MKAEKKRLGQLCQLKLRRPKPQVFKILPNMGHFLLNCNKDDFK